MKKIVDKVRSIGKKANELLSKGFSLGAKAVGKVDTINSKVQKYTKIASSVSSFLPEDAKKAIAKVSALSEKVSQGSGMVKKGLERGAELQAKASKVSDLGGALNLGKEAYFSGKNAVGSTRSFINRPKKGDKTTSVNQKVLQPGVSTAKKAVERLKADTVGAGAVRGVGRPSDDNFAKALKSAQFAQGMMKQKTKKKKGKK